MSDRSADVDFLQALQAHCPMSEEVTLCISRSEGDPEEVDIYEAIGGDEIDVQDTSKSLCATDAFLQPRPGTHHCT